MKTKFLQVFHTKTESGWLPGTFQGISFLHPEDAASINRHFEEHGVKCIPVKEFKKYASNALLVN